MRLFEAKIRTMKRNDNDSSRMVLSPTMKLADLIELNYSLLIVLSRLGIDLGFGENTVAEVCRSHGIDVSSFLLICGVYTYDDYIAPNELLKAGNPADIVKYLHSSHSFYLDDELRKLEQTIGELVLPCDGNQQKVMFRFFSAHDGYSMEQFEENHSNIDEKLNDLKNIVMKYLPSVCDTVLRNSVLYHIFFLEDDLDRHTAIENNVLVPMVNRLEENEKREQ